MEWRVDSLSSTLTRRTVALAITILKFLVASRDACLRRRLTAHALVGCGRSSGARRRVIDRRAPITERFICLDARRPATTDRQGACGLVRRERPTVNKLTVRPPTQPPKRYHMSPVNFHRLTGDNWKADYTRGLRGNVAFYGQL